jgi:rhodanese-related sulfurtransferase
MKRTANLTVLVLVVPLMGFQPTPRIEHTRDSLDTVKKMIASKKAILLDVREQAEWDEGHIKDAVFLPLSKLRKGADPKEIAQSLPKDRIIYCHCRSGVRSLTGAEILKKLGYDVRPLKPGYRDLVDAGFPRAGQ